MWLAFYLETESPGTTGIWSSQDCGKPHYRRSQKDWGGSKKLTGPHSDLEHAFFGTIVILHLRKWFLSQSAFGSQSTRQTPPRSWMTQERAGSHTGPQETRMGLRRLYKKRLCFPSCAEGTSSKRLGVPAHPPQCHWNRTAVSSRWR